MPPSAGEDVTLSNEQTYVRQSNQQDAGQTLRFMMVLRYCFESPHQFSDLFLC